MSLAFLTLGLLSARPADAQTEGPPTDPGHDWQITYSSQNTAESMDYFYGNPNNIMSWGPFSWNDTPGETSSGGSAGGQYAVDASTSGTVKATLNWIPAAGQTLASDPPPPSSQPVHLLESSYAAWGLTGPPNPPPGGVASDGLGDPPVSPLYEVGQISSGTQAIWKDGSSGTITLDPVTLNANTPLYQAPLRWGYATANASFSVGIDPDPAVTISSEIEDSYYKSEDGDSGFPIQLKHVRNEDGSMDVDSAAQWEDASVYSTQGWHVGNLPLTATPVNFQGTPSYSWSLQGLSQGWLTAPTANPTAVSLVEPDWKQFPLTGTVKVDAIDSDGTDVSNTYTVTWHLPMENWQSTGTSAPFWQIATLEGTPGAGPSGTTGPNGSISGQWSFTEDANGKNIGLGDMFAAASGLVDPPWAAFVALTGIVFSKTQSESPVHGVNFNDAWSDSNSTFQGGLPSGWPNSPPAIMQLYQMKPKLLLKYQTQSYQGDQYNLHGYAGPISESYDQWLAWDFAGDFTRISSPPPP